MALCIAIFNKEDVLLFLKLKEKVVNFDNSLEVQRFLYNSYDIIIDKISNPFSKTNQDQFLGSLLLSSVFQSYGYLTNTGTKFLLVIDVENNVLKDHEIRLFFKKLHLKYCNATSNPFYQIGSSLKSRHIDKVVQDFFDCF